jgi:hypothetical protein
VSRERLKLPVPRGYLSEHGLRTNVLHLPVKGNGDRGLYTTVVDIHLLWRAMFGGLIVSQQSVAEMVRPWPFTKLLDEALLR